MKLLEIFFLLLTVSLASAFTQRGLKNDNFTVLEEKEAGVYSRITNGLGAARNQFPYQVYLALDRRPGERYICGGSLIDTYWVLTAAHCIVDAQTIYVILGTINRFQPDVTYQLNQDNVIHHPNFVRSTLVADIALILIPGVIFTDSIQPVHLPARPYTIPSYAGTTAIFAGWGHTSDSSSDNSPTLRYSTFTIISNEVCAHSYPNEVFWGKMCTSSVHQISGCRGDSGGPLVIMHQNIQIGILSHGHPSGCEQGYPTIYTRTDNYLDWISTTTGLEV